MLIERLLVFADAAQGDYRIYGRRARDGGPPSRRYDTTM